MPCFFIINQITTSKRTATAQENLYIGILVYYFGLLGIWGDISNYI